MNIKVNMDKAKKIWKDEWRRARTTLLDQLDVEFIKAIEKGDLKLQEDIKLKKQQLRDVTKIDIAASTTEGIRNIWPEILGERKSKI